MTMKEIHKPLDYFTASKGSAGIKVTQFNASEYEDREDYIMVHMKDEYDNDQVRLGTFTNPIDSLGFVRSLAEFFFRKGYAVIAYDKFGVHWKYQGANNTGGSNV